MNLIAVIVSAIVSMVIGGVWYGPLFGKQFQAASGMDQWPAEKKAAEKAKMGKLYAMQAVASLVMFYVLAMFVDQTGSVGGLTVAFWAWLGFVVPTQLGSAIWGGSMKLFWIGAGNMLVTLLAAGAIIGAWQ